MAHMSVPCHEGPPATKGHFSSEPAVAGRGRYYCSTQQLKLGYIEFAMAGVMHSAIVNPTGQLLLTISTAQEQGNYHVLFQELKVRD